MIDVLHLIDTYRIGGPGKTIINSALFIDRARFRIHVGAFTDPVRTERNEFARAVAAQGIPFLDLPETRRINLDHVGVIRRYVRRARRLDRACPRLSHRRPGLRRDARHAGRVRHHAPRLDPQQRPAGADGAQRAAAVPALRRRAGRLAAAARRAAAIGGPPPARGRRAQRHRPGGLRGAAATGRRCAAASGCPTTRCSSAWWAGSAWKRAATRCWTRSRWSLPRSRASISR